MFALVGREESDAGARDQVAARRRQHGAGRQFRAACQGGIERSGGQHRIQPVAEHAGERRIVAAHALPEMGCGQPRRSGENSGARQHDAERRVGPVVQPRIQLGRVVADDGVEPLAQHRLDRILPAGLDVDLPPQRHGAVEPVPAQPFRQPAAFAGAGLHLLECGAARLTGGQLALDALHFLLRLAPAGLELRQLRLQLLQVILVARQFLAQQRQFFFLLGKIERIRALPRRPPRRAGGRGAG